jgi:hypothetical protein
MTNRSLTLSVAAAALLVASATSASAAAIDLPIDNYLCYQAKESKILAKSGPNKKGAILDYKKFTGFEYSSKDQWEPLARRNYLAAKYVGLCNPIDPAVKSDVHLLELQIKDSKVNVNASKFTPPLDLYNFADRLGMDNMNVQIKKPKSVMVRVGKDDWGVLTKCKTGADCAANAVATECNPNTKICQVPAIAQGPPYIAPVPPFPAVPTDLSNTADYACYQVKGPKVTFPDQEDVEDQFGFADDYQLKKVTKICAPIDKDAPNLAGPSAPTFPGHLICYQAKSLKQNIIIVKGKPKAQKFPTHMTAITGVATGMPNGDYLEAKKITEMCIPAIKAIAPNPAELAIPTTLTATTAASGGVCGTITMNLGGEGVPNRLDPATAENGNGACTGAGTPATCCEGVGTGHCDERTTAICGGVSIGGGGPDVTVKGIELAQPAGLRRRFNLSCGSGTDPACAVSGNVGDLPNGVNCTTTGCGFLSPLDTVLTDPITLKVCGTITLAAPGASGTLNLVTGENTLSLPASLTLYAGTITSIPEQGCPRCRSGTATTNAAVFSTGPDSPGIGVCDADSKPDNDGNAVKDGEVGDTCYVFEGAGSSAGLSSDCTPVSGLPAIGITLPLSAGTAGASIADPVGHFCPGQGGNVDCTGSGAPNPCCTGVGTGTCKNFNGCFGSSNAAGTSYPDTPGICTAVSVTGIPSGAMLAGFDAVDGTIGGLSCLPAVSAPPFTDLINGALGLPSPVAFTVNNAVEVD